MNTRRKNRENIVLATSVRNQHLCVPTGIRAPATADFMMMILYYTPPSPHSPLLRLGDCVVAQGSGDLKSLSEFRQFIQRVQYESEIVAFTWVKCS